MAQSCACIKGEFDSRHAMGENGHPSSDSVAFKPQLSAQGLFLVLTLSHNHESEVDDVAFVAGSTDGIAPSSMSHQVPGAPLPPAPNAYAAATHAQMMHAAAAHPMSPSNQPLSPLSNQSCISAASGPLPGHMSCECLCCAIMIGS